LIENNQSLSKPIKNGGCSEDKQGVKRVLHVISTATLANTENVGVYPAPSNSLATFPRIPFSCKEVA